jgi:hypothetical protein
MAGFLDRLSDNIYHYIDLVWIPVTWLVVEKHQRWKALSFVLVCLMTLRTQTELMESTGYETGFLPIMDSNVYSRGLIAYSVVIVGFLVLAHFSPKTDGMIFFAAGLSIYILAFCFSMLLMAL